MAKAMQTSSPEKILARIKKLFEPPVLTSESLKDYYDIMLRFIECLMPRDPIEELFVVDLTILTWEAKRLSLHKTLLIEREFLRNQEIERKRLQKEQKRKAEAAYWDERRRKESEKEETAGQGEQSEQVETTEQVQQAGASPTLMERMLALDEVINATIPDVDEILMDPADEVDHAAALETGIDYFEQLDRLQGVAIARRNDVLRQIDLHRHGLGQHARRVSDEIIDGEFSETKHDAPLIAGPDADEDAQ